MTFGFGSLLGKWDVGVFPALKKVFRAAMKIEEVLVGSGGVVMENGEVLHLGAGCEVDPRQVA